MTGCAADKRPKYVTPALADDQVATLKGTWGYYIEEVDGARLDVGGFMPSFGGNTAKVSAGEHRLRIEAIGSNSTAMWQTNFTCTAGHLYEVGPSSIMGGVKFTDKMTKTETTIQ